MTIKQVCQRYGLTQDTLRYYEKIGVIPQVHRSSSGIRDYDEQDLSWVENAVCLRSAGVPVESIAEYVKLCRYLLMLKSEVMDVFAASPVISLQ